MLEEIFKRYKVPIWGIASLEKTIEGSDGYKCIAFCFPYDSDAVAALPDDNLMNSCKKELADKTKVVYTEIQKKFRESRFEFYDNINRKLKLCEKGVSQKVLAHLAGLGWIGKSSLLITSKYGPRVRIGTIFTKDDLGETGFPFTGDCADCMICLEICPSGAIEKNGLNEKKCRQIVSDANGEYKTFCGLCMQVCPIGNANKI